MIIHLQNKKITLHLCAVNIDAPKGTLKKIPI